jgi:ATP-dependent protease HslVU (ClpYQ) peptidase subunit
VKPRDRAVIPCVFRPYIQVSSNRCSLTQRETVAELARRAMAIAADICVCTNGNLTAETIKK